MPPMRPETVTAAESASRPFPMRFRSGAFQSASLIFSHIVRLPMVLSAPVMDAIRNAGSIHTETHESGDLGRGQKTEPVDQPAEDRLDTARRDGHAAHQG